MPEVEIISNEIERLSPTQARISIQLRLNGFLFCVDSLIDNKVIALRSYEFENETSAEEYLISRFKKVLSEDDILQHFRNYAEVSFVSEKMLLMPETYFDESTLKSFFVKVHQLQYADELHYKKLQNLPAVCSYAISNNISNMFYQHFKTCKFIHQGINLIYLAQQYHFSLSQPVLTVNIENHFIEICAVGLDNESIFYNSFPHTIEDEIVYHTANTLKQLKALPNDINLLVCGNLPYEGREIGLLKKYFSKVYQLDPSLIINFDERLNAYPLHEYATLFNSETCG